MYVCVECGHPVPTVYQEFTKGSASAIRLTRCENKACGKIADKYVEYETVIIVLDMILLKQRVYRHLLFNRRENGDGMSKAVKTLAVWCILFDAYLRWFRLREWYEIQVQVHGLWIFVVTLLAISVIDFVVFLGAVSWMVQLYRKDTKSRVFGGVDSAVILSSFGKLFSGMLMVWEYHSFFGILVNIFTLSSNVLAIKVYMRTTMAQSALIVGLAFLVRIGVQVLVQALLPTYRLVIL